MDSIKETAFNQYKIAYYLVTDIQHIPPVIRLFPHLGGIVLTRNEDILNQIKTKYIDYNINCYLVKTRKEANKVIQENKIRVVIYPSYHFLFRGKAIQIFHGGLSDKNYVESVKILMYDMVLFPGEKTKDKVNNSGYLKFIPKWQIIGYPKFDPLVNKTLSVIPVFNNNKKTILYAPTWISQFKNFTIVKFSDYGESSLNIWAKDIITELHKDYNIIIKYHSRIFREPNDIYDQIDNLIIELGAQENVKIKIDDNILPYMYQADLMISDISTACYEWFHFDKPIVFANPSPEHYSPSDDIGSNTYAWQAGDVINSKEDIKKFVDRNIESDSYKIIRNKIFNYTIFKPDGNATQRQVESIKEFYSKYQKTPYWYLILTSFIFRRFRREKSKLLNKYYRYFKKEKIGK
jgi:hypothetical protein